MTDETREIVHKKAMNLLARREHSRFELEKKLHGHAPQPVIDNVLSMLEQQDILSDTRFTAVVVRHYAEKCYGPCYISEKLETLGIKKEMYWKILDSYKSQWPALAKKQRIKHFGSEQCVGLERQKKQIQYLSRRGFCSEDIENAF